MNIKLQSRRLANKVVNRLPKSLLKHFLKSIWQQPRLQDNLLFHVQPYRFDSAIPTLFDIDLAKLDARRNLPGIMLDQTVYLDWLSKLRVYASELADIPTHETPGTDFWFQNGSYGDLDAVTLYTMLRHLKPKRIIEIGSGRSSRMIERAAAKNNAEGSPCNCTFIEPFPPEYFVKSPPPGTFLQKKVQDIQLSIFKELDKSDVLFIDTSHVLKTQGDCCFELLEIIPSLRQGVVVHVHDIFTPYDYPKEWLFERQFPFNEQYALECLLSCNSDHQIILPTHLLWREHRRAILELLPQATDTPGAFWFINQGKQ